MSDSADPHVQAVVDLLRAAGTPENIAVYVGRSPNEAVSPYWVVYPPPPLRSITSLAHTSDDVDLSIQVSSFGDEWEAGNAALVANDALIDHVPVVAGRSCWPIRSETSQPVREDVDEADLFVAVAVYAIRSTPA